MLDAKSHSTALDTPVAIPVTVSNPPTTSSSSSGRKERKWKGSSKPDWIDSYSWVSMSLPVRKRMIELTNKDKESQAPAPAASPPAPEPGGAAPESKTGKVVNKSLHYEIIEDDEGDLRLEFESPNRQGRVYVCSRKAIDIKAGKVWSPKSRMRCKMAKCTWQIIRGLEGNSKFHITCNGDVDNASEFNNVTVLADPKVMFTLIAVRESQRCIS